MMCRPALRFAIGPFPPLRLDERFLAATILAPLVLLAMFSVLRQHILTCRSSVDELWSEIGNRRRGLGPLYSPGKRKEHDSENDQNQAIEQPESLQEVDGSDQEKYDPDHQTDDADDRPRRAFSTHRGAPKVRYRNILDKVLEHFVTQSFPLGRALAEPTQRDPNQRRSMPLSGLPSPTGKRM